MTSTKSVRGSSGNPAAQPQAEQQIVADDPTLLHRRDRYRSMISVSINNVPVQAL